MKDLKSESVQLSFKQSVPLGTSTQEITIKAKASGSVALADGKSLFDKEMYEKEKIELPAGQKYLSTSFKASVNPEGSKTVGDLKFGFGVGVDCTLTCSQPVDENSELAPAIKRAIEAFTVPADIEDIASMPDLSVASVEGNGSIKFSVEIDAPITPISLASVPTSISGIGIKVNAGPKLGVQIAPSITGGYRLQVSKLDRDYVLLAYSRKHGEKLEVTFTGSAGISATVPGVDLVQEFLKAVFPDAKIPENDLKRLNISADEIKAMTSAIEGGIEKSLQFSLQEKLDASIEHGTAFLYRIHLPELDATARAAVNHALDGDLTMIEAKTSPMGVTRVRSIVHDTRENSRAFRLSLFGILNAGSVHDYLKTTKWIEDRETHDVTLVDTASASEVGYRIDNLAKDSQKLRRLLADGALATCAYKAGKTGYQPNITISFWAFDLQQSAPLAWMQSHLNIADALKMNAPVAKQTITASAGRFGRTIFNAEVKLDDALFDSLFFETEGVAHSEGHYVKLGREAMVKVLPPDLNAEIRDARQAVLRDERIWEELSQAGAFDNFRAILASHLARSSAFDLIANDIYGDYLIIEWWATAMSGVARPLAELRRFLKEKPLTDPHDNNLSKLRGKLNQQIRNVLLKTHDRFSDPWGLVAMDLASGQRGEASMLISSPALTLTLKREKTPSAMAAVL